MNPRSPVEYHRKRKFHKSKWKHQKVAYETLTCNIPTSNYVRLDWLKPSEKRNADRQQTKKEEGNPSWILQVKFEYLSMLLFEQTMQLVEFKITMKKINITKIWVWFCQTNGLYAISIQIQYKYTVTWPGRIYGWETYCPYTVLDIFIFSNSVWYEYTHTYSEFSSRIHIPNLSVGTFYISLPHTQSR